MAHRTVGRFLRNRASVGGQDSRKVVMIAGRDGRFSSQQTGRPVPGNTLRGLFGIGNRAARRDLTHGKAGVPSGMFSCTWLK